ncbi:MAG: phosphatase PAP2 family protein [Clostridiales bacterium]|nr:phosphatase PAP2 family protein [Clostridiales bacterium]
MAGFLNRTFRAFDRAAFAGMHALHNAASGFFDNLCKFVSFLADGGWCYIVTALILLLFCRTRKVGLAMGIALVIGALITNILLKNTVRRPRPYTQSDEFFSWWTAAGKNVEDSFSFPSGHSTASFAAMVAFFFIGNKKYSWTGLLFAALVAFSRVYLIVHYTTDVLAGLIIGSVAGVCGGLLCKLIYNKAGGKFKQLLYSVDAISVVKAIANKHKGEQAATTENAESIETVESVETTSENAAQESTAANEESNESTL